MTICDLIARLSGLLREHGDIDVEIDGRGEVGEIRHVEVDDGWDYYHPDKVVIEAK